MQITARKTGSLPPRHSCTTTAIIHQEQSPWSSTRDSSDVLNVKNVLQRAKSVNIKTGKPTKTRSQVSDDTDVRYNWSESIKETSLDVVKKERLGSSSAASTAAVSDQQNGVGSAGAENNGSPPSEGQSDYQLPASVASDQCNR